MRLGARIVRELELEQTNDTLACWMAHHLAEVLQEAENAEGDDKELAHGRAVDLILKIWSHRRSLPGGAYPLNKLEPVLSVLGRLEPKPSLYQQRSSNETEELLTKIFEGLRLVVVHGTILISQIEEVPDDLDTVIPFLDDDERQIIEAIRDWIDYAKPEFPRLSFAPLTEEEILEQESKEAEMAELEKLDSKSRSNRIFSKEIDELIEALSELKVKIAAEDPEANGED